MTDDARPEAVSGRGAALLVYAHDVALAALAMAGVLFVRYRLEPKPIPDQLLGRSTLVFAAVCAVVFPLFRLHRGLWRYTAADDLLRLAGAVLAADVLVLPILFAFDRLQDFPRSVPLVLPPLLFVLLAFGRALTQAQARGDLGAALRFERRDLPAAVVVGSARAAADYIGGLRRRRDPPVRVAGVVALDAVRAGRTVRGAEVLGPLNRLTDILRALRAAEGTEPHVVLVEPRPPRALLDAVVAAAAGAGAHVSRLRDAASTGDLAPVQAADLLARPPRVLDAAAPRRLVEGRRVLVTGAGGTIGSELTRQVLRMGPAELTLVDASEFNLYAIDGELRAGGAPPVWRTVLADVRDRARMGAIFADARPQVVLHAAALKHVPLMELNPTEAVRTNLGGTVVVAELACAGAGLGAEALVFISTDKAVNPTNVMGATKRAAEQVVQAMAAGGACRVSAVRFGNVLGSTGSVAPLFERQIAAGGPVTVTHPDMVRYFMTVQEAAALVLQAAALPQAALPQAAGDAPGEGGVYVLDMGEPVRIEDLARQMIRLHGLRPDTDVAIVHTGLRPGEKLYEEIFYDAETARPTGADGVFSASDAAPDWAELRPRVEALLAAAEAQDAGLTLARLQALVPQFTRA